MNFEEFNEKMGRRPARCCGNCHFVINQENYAPFCLVNGYPINEFFTCKFFAFNDDSGLSERQYIELNNLASEALKEREKRIKEREKTHETIRDNTGD